MKGKKAWPMPYMRGSHCFSTMIANALADSAWAMSEELVYILGCGLGFVFHRENMVCYINSRMHDLEHFFVRHTGARIVWVSHVDAMSMLETTRDWLAEGRAVYFYCEARELPLFADVIPWHQIHSFGTHALPVSAVQHSRSVVCCDYLWSRSFKITFEDLSRATFMYHNSTLQRAAPQGPYTVAFFEPPYGKPKLFGALMRAIYENVRLFLEPVNNSQGVRALKSLERNLSSLIDLTDSTESLRRELASMGIMLEKVGTGGGAGRHLYSRGLKQCSEILHIPELSLCARDYAKSGRKWRALAHDMIVRSQSVDPTIRWKDLVLAVRMLRNMETTNATQLLTVSETLLNRRRSEHYD